MAKFTGTAGDDNLTGTSGNDKFNLSQGGNDTAHGGDGNDQFTLNGALNAADRIDGGTGTDTVTIKGDYSAGVVFDAATITGIEKLHILAGFDYSFTSNDGNIAAGEKLTVNATALGAGDNLTFDGSAETDGGFIFQAGAGDDNLTGGATRDVFTLGKGGNDIAHGGGGNDLFNMAGGFNAGDQLDGGTGTDTLSLDGNYAGANAIVMGAGTIANFETILLAAGHTYSLTMNDANVAAGQGLTVDASALASAFTFNGAAESDGHFTIIGGTGGDTLSGGNAGNVFDLTRGGHDTANGGQGVNVFNLGNAFDTSDRINGALGAANTMVLNGPYFGMTVTNTMIANVQTVDFQGINTTSLVWKASGALTVDASVAGGSLSFDYSAVASSLHYIGGALNSQITGGSQADTFGAGSGIDIFTGNGGNDTFNFGANFAANDTVDGGAGSDTLTLNGDYSSGIGMTATTLVNVETLQVANGHDYNLATNDATVASGQTLTVDGSALSTARHLIFNGAAETNGSFAMTGGAGADTLTGGALADSFNLSLGGNDTVHGGGGNDTILMGTALTAGDSIDGGTGSDTVVLNGDYAGLTLGAGTLSAVETLQFAAGHSYTITANNGNVASGQTLAVDGSALGAGDVLTFSGASETDGSFAIAGGAGNDVLTGGTQADTFTLNAGGNDTVHGGNGGDTIAMGAALTASDSIDGGTGSDTVVLSGNYSAGLAFGASTITNVETLQLAAGNSYNLTTSNGNVASGQTLTVDASALGAGNVLTFNGAAESDGSFAIVGGAANDVLTGGAQADSFDLSHGGNDTVHGGGGNDTIQMGGALTASDTIDGGTGSDTLVLGGNYTAGFTFGASTMSAIETLQVAFGNSYNLTTNNANVASGQVLLVDASALIAGETLTFNGAAETDGTFGITGGAGNDVLIGGGGADSFMLFAGGNDTVHGGAGNDAIIAGAALTASDIIDGGADTDTLTFGADYAGLVLGASTLNSIEVLQFLAGHSYNVTSNDGNVGAGLSLTVDASVLGAGDVLTFNGAAELDGAFSFFDGAGNDVLTGGAQADSFNLSGGGSDTAHGGGGNDTFTLGAALTAADTIDGGAGTDTLALNGDYSAGLVLGATTLGAIETLQFASGHDYNLTSNDGNVAAGQTLGVDASALAASNALTFDGSAESDGSFAFIGGAGSDVLTGGGLADTFALTAGGNDTVHGGGGNDTFTMGAALTASDSIDGGAGGDTVTLSGSAYAAGLTFGTSTFTSIETITLASGFNYNLTSDDGNVAAGQSLIVDGSSLGSGNTLTFNGAAETDGTFVLNGGAGNDALTGGAQNDTFNLSGGGNDTAHGGDGGDTFNLGAAFTASDTIDGGAGNDTLVLDGAYSSFTFGAASMVNVETVLLTAGHAYSLATNDANVAAGQTLTVDGTTLSGANTLTFDGSAETDGFFTLLGGSGNDAFNMGGALKASDQISGGAGTDTLNLNGDYSAGIVFGATTMTGIENLTLASGHSYNLTTDDANIASGQTLTVDASALGASDTLTFDVSAETDGKFNITAGAGDDVLSLGAKLTASSQINGGDGFDTVGLYGNYTLTFNASTMTNVEQLTLATGGNYSLTTNNATVAAGESLTVDASALGAGNTLTFNGAAETNGFLTITGGAGNDALTGGSLEDTFNLGAGGNDTVHAGAGDDTINVGAAFTNSDTLDGAGGNDTVVFDGDYSAGLVFGTATFTSIDFLTMTAGHSYNFTTVDTNVASGQELLVDASTLGAGDTLTFNGAAETNADFVMLGGAGNDVLTGGAQGDTFDISAGGVDTVQGGAGDDTIAALGALTASDQIDGGAGTGDLLGLNGDYSAGLVFAATTMTNVETLQFQGNFSYNITLDDANIASGQTLTVLANQVGAANTVIFDMSADTNGFLAFTGGASADTVKIGARLNTTDHINGNAGSDTLELNGDYSSGLTLGATTVTNVEKFVFDAGHSYNLTTNNATVTGGGTLTVDGSALGAGDTLTFTGSAEGESHFAMTGGAGNDTLTGGAVTDSFDLSHGGADTVTGNGGADSITALAGAQDVFVYSSVSDSTSTGHDTIINADFDNHVFNVSAIGAVTGTDAALMTGALNQATFDSNLAAAVGAGQLAAHHAMLFTASTGDLAGHTFLVIDENGTAGYQANADLVIEIVNGTGTLSLGDFA